LASADRDADRVAVSSRCGSGCAAGHFAKDRDWDAGSGNCARAPRAQPRSTARSVRREARNCRRTNSTRFTAGPPAEVQRARGAEVPASMRPSGTVTKIAITAADRLHSANVRYTAESRCRTQIDE
jgi:hypothetical protein